MSDTGGIPTRVVNARSGGGISCGWASWEVSALGRLGARVVRR
jgi:hypothetical protein